MRPTATVLVRNVGAGAVALRGNLSAASTNGSVGAGAVALTASSIVAKPSACTAVLSRYVVSALLSVGAIVLVTGSASAQVDSISQANPPGTGTSTPGSPMLSPISLAPPTAVNLPVDQGLRQINDNVHKMQWALAGIVREARRTEVDVTANPMFIGGVGCPYPFGYDPEMLDPLESYGFDFGLDTSPTLTHDTGKLLPLRKEVVDPLVAQVNDDMNGIWTDANAVRLPDALSDDSKAQWDVLTDTLKRMQQHVQWLQDACRNNLDDNALIAQSAIHIHDDAAGIDEIAKRLLKILRH